MLKVREVRLFEEHTGIPFTRALNQLRPKFCQLHRMEIARCEACQKAASQICVAHVATAQTCDGCEGSAVTVDVAAALVWIVRRREDPEALLDDVEELEYPDLMAELGNAFSGPSQAPSPPSMSPGSPLSSASTPDSP